ncbi:hypothetical protein NG791_02340 [Laspinema sp. D1]|uniref:hypothetical protein n=1 Tax=Laspinema palackyanum TaxID=3231601 RepID=UPI003486660F|nr:hypothetical protein [Laspinema sp. D2b]
MARGGLGWGPSWAIAHHEERGWTRLHTGAIASFDCVTWRSASQKNPTLALPLLRGGDRRCGDRPVRRTPP